MPPSRAKATGPEAKERPLTRHLRLRARRTWAKVGVLAVVLGLWFVFAAPRSLGGPVSVVWVSGTSMEPALANGDLSLLYSLDSYDVGDIVAFDIPEGGTVIHRVERAEPDGYTFRGDTREAADPWLLHESASRGTQILRIPNAQFLLTMLGRPEVVAGVVAGVIILVRSRETEEDEVEQAPLGGETAAAH